MQPCEQANRLERIETLLDKIEETTCHVTVKNGGGMDWTVPRQQFDQKIYDLAKSVDDLKTFLTVGKRFKVSITEVIVILFFIWQVVQPFIIKHTQNTQIKTEVTK